MDNPIAFRKSVGGYNKDDVNSYISDSNLKFKGLEEEYQKTIKELKTENESIKSDIEKIKCLEVKVETLEKEKSDLTANLSQKDKEVKEKENTIELLRTQLESAEKTIYDATKKINQVSKSTKSIDPEIYNKAEKYDELSDEVEQIIDEAKLRAKQIIDNANKSVALKTEKRKKKSSSEPTSLLDELRIAIKKKLKDF